MNGRPAWWLALACVPAAACPGLTFEAGWTRTAPPGAGAMAGYGQLRNAGSAPLHVGAASSPQFAAVEFHRTVLDGGMARMQHAAGLTLAPGETRVMEPGGWHLMLMRPVRDLRAGERVELAFECDGARSAAELSVRAP